MRQNRLTARPTRPAMRQDHSATPDNHSTAWQNHSAVTFFAKNTPKLPKTANFNLPTTTTA
jgi:hypothetical protein